MIGSLYFVVKSSVLTVVIVCLLQIQFRDQTLEDRLMDFVRTSLAPQMLGQEQARIDQSTYKMSPKDMAALKKKVFESEALKDVRSNVKSLFLKEMNTVMDGEEKEDR